MHKDNFNIFIAVSLNRAISADKDGFLHLVPPAGEYPGSIEIPGQPALQILQVIDASTYNSIIADYEAEKAKPDWPGYLLDQEHFSHDKNASTEAFAWFKTLQRRPDGIWGLPEWTDIGDQVVKNKRYKNISPALGVKHLSGNRYQVVALLDAGLTNRPRFRNLVPIQNRDQNSAANEAAGKDVQMFEQLRTLMKQPADATETTVLAAVQSVMNRADAAQTEIVALKTRAEAAEAELTTIKTETLNRDADAFVLKHKAIISDPVKVKALFVKNRADAEEFVSLLKPPAEAPKNITLNRSETATPPEQVAAETKRLNDRRACIEELVVKNKCTYTEANNIAITLHPELFIVTK